MLVRAGKALGLVAGASVLAKLRLDHGGWRVPGAEGTREVRDYRTADHGGPSDFAVVHAQGVPDVGAMVREALGALGGIARFVSRGDVVVLKPNIGWDRTPMQAANTNPEVVAQVATLCLQAGARRVVVTDASCNDPGRCFQRSGIWARAHRVGAEVILPAEHRFRTMRLRGEVLDEWPVYRTLIEADKVINLPVAKHHNLAKYTAAMKNWYGTLGGRRNRLHQNIDVSIADLATFMRPTLTVVDALRVLLRNGPQGGNVDDTRRMNTILATVDQVAADAYGCTLIDQRPENLAYLRMGEARGLGTTRWQSLRPRELALDMHGGVQRYALVVPEGSTEVEVARRIHAGRVVV
ncbi:MAG: DUF362 domain-containing protein [Deltaproteobacteria bacterium]|nr:DUF362 domain-containing protein [Deltaproteobacteria bacterium]